MSACIIITGGSRGIGAATARLAAARGYAVCLSYRNDQEAAASIAEAVRATGARALVVRADLAIEADVVGLFTECEAELGTPVALVNNAGIVDRQSTVEHMKVERLQRMFTVNVVGAFLCAREAVKRMSTLNGGAGGTIVNVSSIASRLGSPGEYVDYAASKGAIDSFTIGLAKEVADAGIRVNAVRPGVIDTEIHALSGEPDRVARVSSGVPMRRGGQAEEVARAILWLLSDEASYITGSFLDVSGGR